MPVEDIKLAHLHEVQVISQDRLGDVVATGVHQDSPVSEAWRVVDVGFFHKVLKEIVLASELSDTLQYY